MKVALLIALACASPQEPRADFAIVHFNDLHGQIRPRLQVRHPGRPAEPAGGFAALAAHVERQRAQWGERLWVTNGGDWFQGTPEGNTDRGASVLACLDGLDLTASVLGNHEYDFGEPHLIALLERARHPILGANVLERGTARLRPYVRPYVVKTVQLARAPPRTARLALVGLITSDTPVVSTGPFGSAEFADEVETLQALWPALRRDADFVVLLTHCGVATDRELARRFPDLALILGGHSHTALRRPIVEGKTHIVQSGSRGTAVSELELRIELDPPALELAAFRFVELEAGASNEAIDAALGARFAHVAQQWDRPIGVVRGAPDRRAGAGSTPAGSFVAALIRAAGSADVGLMNKGGLRTELRSGEVTRRDVFELVPFDNGVVTVELTGAELRRVLAAGLRPERRPLEIDGAVYAYETVDGVRVLRDVVVGAAPLDDARPYRVATNSFLAGGGDGQTALAAAPRLAENPRLLRDLVLDHLAATGEIVLRDDERIRFARD